MKTIKSGRNPLTVDEKKIYKEDVEKWKEIRAAVMKELGYSDKDMDIDSIKKIENEVLKISLEDRVNRIADEEFFSKYGYNLWDFI